MRNEWLHLSIAVGLTLAIPLVAGAETIFKTTGVEVNKKWIVHKTDKDLADAPNNLYPKNAKKHEGLRMGYLATQESVGKLWKSWRTDEPPEVDFSKNIVLVLTARENVNVDFELSRDGNDNVRIGWVSSAVAPKGMTYVIAVLPRAGIKSINGVEVAPAK